MSNNYAVDERTGAMKRAVDLITDMSVNGATQEELERAIMWSADIVRSNKEGVDWKRSYEYYVIADLEDKYQKPDVPVKIVEQLIEKHGGYKGIDKSNLGEENK